MQNFNPVHNFYWQTARDSLLTPSALQMFQIALKHDGQPFVEAKGQIDEEYAKATGGKAARHGGNFNTFVRVFEEAGWISLKVDNGNEILHVTGSGRQAEQLLISTPDFLKVVPYFLLELLSRFQLNNPSGPTVTKNLDIKDSKSRSNIFPYWTIWKIMRSCEDFIMGQELRRFVFRLHRSEDITKTIVEIQKFRKDVALGLSENELDAKYPEPLKGAVGESKYIMGRAGIHIGSKPPVIEKVGASKYILNPCYNTLIDFVLNNAPVFQEYLDADSWFKEYSQYVPIDGEYIPFLDPDIDGKLEYDDIVDDDPVWQQVDALIKMGVRNILFTGPPGTSKTTYALAIGAKLVSHNKKRFRNVQFHQSYGYEDFIEGFVPAEDASSIGAFTLEPKVFKLACEVANADDKDNLHVLVIDEFNRGEPSRIFGEALTYIERRDQFFDLPSSTRKHRKQMLVPSNLVILATMNPIDRSIADLDMALERRFEKINMPPDEAILKTILFKYNSISNELGGRVISLFKKLNSEMGNTVGHAYFKDVKDLNTMTKVWEHLILPFIDKELRYDSGKQQALHKYFDSNFPPQDIKPVLEDVPVNTESTIGPTGADIDSD